MQLNSQFNAQFPDVEKVMEKPMDDEKLQNAALEAGAGRGCGSGNWIFTDDELHHLAALLTDPLRAELERQAALVQQQAKVIAGLVKALEKIMERSSHEVESGVIRWDARAVPSSESLTMGLKSLAAAAPFLPQTKDEKEK